MCGAGPGFGVKIPSETGCDCGGDPADLIATNELNNRQPVSRIF
jgi:hypothetical protein